MLQTLIGPIAELAGGWLNAKTQAQQANAKLKLTEAEACLLYTSPSPRDT